MHCSFNFRTSNSGGDVPKSSDWALWSAVSWSSVNCWSGNAKCSSWSKMQGDWFVVSTKSKLEPFFKTQPYITMIMKKKAERQEERSVGALVVVKDRRFQETAFRPQRARNIGHLSGDRSLANAPELVGLGVNGDPQFMR